MDWQITCPGGQFSFYLHIFIISLLPFTTWCDVHHVLSLILAISSGPTMFLVLSREDAVHGWRTLMGPTDPEEAKESAPQT